MLLRILFSALIGPLFVNAAPNAGEQGISTLTDAQVAMFKPYTYYASAAACPPAKTLAWNCGRNCDGNPTFKPVSSGGDGAFTQYWYVGFDPTLQTIIVGYQGSDPSKIIPIITDAVLLITPLNPFHFPGVSIFVGVHVGFALAQAQSAGAVLSAVKSAMAQYGATKVTVVGHSMGAAIALISSVYLPLHLPPSTKFQTVVYGMPRVGNQAFANYVDAHANVTRINNQDDFVPVYPDRLLGYVHPKGEVHIVNSNAWIACSGHENTDAQCTLGYVPNILAGDVGDHGGPYDNVSIGF